MEKEKDSIVLYGNMLRAITKLPPENCLEMMKAISAFVNKEEFTFSNPVSEAWFSELVEIFKRDGEQYEEVRTTRAKFGRLGGLKRSENMKKSQAKLDEHKGGQGELEELKQTQANSSKAKQNVALLENPKQSQANQADTETDTETDKEKEKQKEKESGGRPPRRDIFSFLPQNFAESEDFVRAWNDWLAYRRERKLGKWVEATLKSKAKEFAEWGLEATIANIAYSIGNGYQGIFAQKSPGPNPKGGDISLEELKRAYKHKVNFYDPMFTPSEYQLKALKAEDIESFKRYLGPEFYGLEELAAELAKKGVKR